MILLMKVLIIITFKNQTKKLDSFLIEFMEDHLKNYELKIQYFFI